MKNSNNNTETNLVATKKVDVEAEIQMLHV